MNTLREGMVQLNIPIPEDLRDRLDELIIKRCGYVKRGILGDVVTQAIREFINKREGMMLDLDHTHTHEIKEDTRKNSVMETKEKKKTEATISYVSSNNRKSKYDKLVTLIKRYSNEEKQIHSGLAKKAIKEIIGRDQRTIDKYLNILQENDILYPDEKLGVYDVQSWVFEDYKLPALPIQIENKVPELELKKQ